MQHYVKVEYSQFGVAVLRERIRVQYAFNVAGTACALPNPAAAYARTPAALKSAHPCAGCPPTDQT